jgi:hypothetical protein
MKQMPRRFVFRAAALGFFLALHAARAAAPSNDLLASPWQAVVDTTKKVTEIALAQDKAGLSVTVKNLADNRIETGPHLHLHLAAAQDWRGYQTLKCRMRLTSDAAPVIAGGKDLSFCFYDAQTRHEMLDVPVQQAVDAHLAAGEWQDLTLNLRPLGRAAITDADIYLRVQPYGITHTYKVEISQFELVKDDRPMFDGKGMSAVLSGGGGEMLENLGLSHGLQVQVGRNGGISGVTVNDHEIGNAAQAGGFLVRDNASDAPPVAVGGHVEAPLKGAVTQSADLDALGLHVESRYGMENGRIRISLKATNLRKDTRYLTLYFALPLQKKAWSWGNDINGSVAIPAGSTRPYEENTVQYPFATLTTPEAGIALAVPLDQPRNYRLAYNEQTGLFYAAFDVALAPITTSAGKSLNDVTCDAYIYAFDPHWGFRAALQAYYDAFPQWFTKRVKRDGGWDIERIRKPGYTHEEILASGCRFAWEQAPDATAVWQHQNGILNTIYISPKYMNFGMADLVPSDDAARARLQALAAGDEAEWKKIEPLHYTQNYAETPYAVQHGLKAYHQLLAQACLASGVWTADGKLPLDVGYRDWIGDSGLSMHISSNVEPAIPHGRGQLAFDLMDAIARSYHEKIGLAPDGWALDSYVCDDQLDYRAENFRYASVPLTFARDGLQPVSMIRLTMASWIDELARRSRPQNEVIFGNLVGNFTFSVPQLDIFGSEASWVHDPAYLRSMAYHRPVTSLLYTPKPDLQIFFDFLYGIYPGRGIVQKQYEEVVPVLDQITPAGWEPVTHARADAPRVRVERFGSGDHCYLVFHNNAPAARAFQVTVDGKALGTAAQKATVLFGPQKGQTVAAANGSLPFQLGSRETCVVKLD